MSFYVVLPLKLFNAVPGVSVGLILKIYCLGAVGNPACILESSGGFKHQNVKDIS